MNAPTLPRLPMWVIYDHPTDYPLCYVARRWEAMPREQHSTGLVRTHASLEALRQQFWDEGLYCIPRYPEDDPVIVEVWI